MGGSWSPPSLSSVTAVLVSACSGAGQAPARRSAATSVSASDPAPWVLFQQDAGDRQEVALIRADGSDRNAPLHDLAGGHQSNPDWSPDGKQFVFAMSDGERDDLWVADADGATRTCCSTARCLCRWFDDPDWSPDGKQIVYSRTILRPSGWGIGTLETVAVATGQVRVVLGPWKRDFTAGARYSPDGRQVVFEKVHKTGARPGRRHRRRDPDCGAPRQARATRSARSPTRGCSPPPPTGARTGAASCTPRCPAPHARGAGPVLAPPGGGMPTRLTHAADDGGFAARAAPGSRTAPGCCSAAFPAAVPGVPELLTVRLDGSGFGSAFSDQTRLRAPPSGPADALSPRPCAARPSRSWREGRGVVDQSLPGLGRHAVVLALSRRHEAETQACRSRARRCARSRPPRTSAASPGGRRTPTCSPRRPSPRSDPGPAEDRVHRAPVAVDVQRHAERRGWQVGQHRRPRPPASPASRAARRTSARVIGSDTHVPSSGLVAPSAPEDPEGVPLEGSSDRPTGVGVLVGPLGHCHGHRRDGGRGHQGRRGPASYDALVAAPPGHRGQGLGDLLVPAAVLSPRTPLAVGRQRTSSGTSSASAWAR